MFHFALKAALAIGLAVVLLPPASLLVLLRVPASNPNAYALAGKAMLGMGVVVITLLMVRAAGYRLGPWKTRV